MTKRDLQKYLLVDAQIDELILERCALMDRATKITPALNGMPHAPGVSDKIGNAIAILDGIDKKIVDKIDELREEQEKIEAAIYSIPDDRLIMLMRYRYILGMTWEKIAESMNIKLRQAYYMHNSALAHVAAL